MHGTFVAGILCAKRGSVALAISPDCTLIIRTIFAEDRKKKTPLTITLNASHIVCACLGSLVIRTLALAKLPNGLLMRSE
jgi:hypothetical protein